MKKKLTLNKVLDKYIFPFCLGTMAISVTIIVLVLLILLISLLLDTQLI